MNFIVGFMNLFLQCKTNKKPKMKKFATILTVALALNAANLFANTTPPENLKEAMSELSVMFKNNAQIEIEKDSDILVTFTVNEDNELAVLKVHTTDEKTKDFIKNAIHNKKLNKGNLVMGKQYQFFVKMKKQ